jgi:hypothetical protein
MSYSENEIDDVITHLTGERSDFILETEISGFRSHHLNLPNWVIEEGVEEIKLVNNSAVVKTKTGRRYTAEAVCITGESVWEEEPNSQELINANGDSIYDDHF